MLCVVSMEGKFIPYSEAAAADVNTESRAQSPCGGNNHTYPIVKVDIEADT